MLIGVYPFTQNAHPTDSSPKIDKSLSSIKIASTIIYYPFNHPRLTYKPAYCGPSRTDKVRVFPVVFHNQFLSTVLMNQNHPAHPKPKRDQGTYSDIPLNRPRLKISVRKDEGHGKKTLMGIWNSAKRRGPRLQYH